MNKPIIILTCALLAASTPLGAADAPEPGKQTPQSLQKEITRSVAIEYLAFVPSAYASNATTKWPVILFLHGAGERGSNLELVTKHGPPKIVREKPEFPFIVISPQCPAGKRWEAEQLLLLLDEIKSKYRVDPNRVYLTGLSMGGYGTWTLGLTHPELFAAIAPICGGGDPIAILLADPTRREHLKALPVWAFHGAKDPVVKPIESERMIDALKKIGNMARLTVYPEAGHDSWTEAYDSKELYDWFLSHDLTDRAATEARR